MMTMRAQAILQMWLLFLLMLIGILAPGLSRAAGPVAAAEAPSRSVLVLDTSGSMVEGRRPTTPVGALAATLAIVPDGGQVAIVTFNHRAAVLAPLTRLDAASRRALLSRVETLRAGGGTDLLAAVGRALDLLG